MNIFYLNHNTELCAQEHVDKHVVKMILEYAQLLSTAHRFLDGISIDGYSKTGRKQTRYVLSDDRDTLLYASTHINHPSAVWVRQSQANYVWLYELFGWLCNEYTYRYGKHHATARLDSELMIPPKNIPLGKFTEPTPAMPDNVKIIGDSIASYKNYYIKNKGHLASWKKRNIPEWYNANICVS
jgi:hypothetical protein